MTITISLPAHEYEDADDCLTTAEAAVCEALGLEGWRLAPRWNDDAERSAILLDLPDHVAAAAERFDVISAPCACGAWSGERCCWEGDPLDMVLVDFLPEVRRGAYRAACEGGHAGTWAQHGGERIRVEPSCAARMVELDGEFVEVLS